MPAIPMACFHEFPRGRVIPRNDQGWNVFVLVSIDKTNREISQVSLGLERFPELVGLGLVNELIHWPSIVTP